MPRYPLGITRVNFGRAVARHCHGRLMIMLLCLGSRREPNQQRPNAEPATTIGLAGFGIAEQAGDPLRDALAGTGSGAPLPSLRPHDARQAEQEGVVGAATDPRLR